MTTAAAIGLPECFDYALLYIHDTLPAPLYSLLISILANSLALFTALQTLLTSLISTSPLNWDALTVLPPLISIFAAYLALLSLYRTTSWILRSSIWILKWGTILGALMAGAGWFMGNTVQGGVGNYGAVSNIGGFVLDVINGQGKNAGRSRSRPRKSHLSRSAGKKPKIWESFERHREWKNQGKESTSDESTTISQIFNHLLGVASRGGQWWNVAEYADRNDVEKERTEGQSRRNIKSSSSRSR
jgi:hypothetical protein